MRLSVSFSLCLMFVFFASSGKSASAIVIVDPDAFADGTDISVAFPGVTLSGPGQADTSVSSLTSGFASTGTQVFGSGDDGIEWGDGFNAGMRVDFATDVSYVSIDLIGNDSSDDGRLLAYNSANTLLETYTSGILGSGDVETAIISRAVDEIAYVIATGDSADLDSVSLDNLRYSRLVPEPTTYALVGLCFMGIAFCRRA